ncbi:MAG: tsaA [Gammaproteobacteria bacterium]|jgi:peroxiredoxin (alkyl hydroperoxide reductase subunit C)|nr:tsaA [Gammaproteobacteria bacterium]MCE3238786.1 tsaA [Gammaproteobacteria bacterium]
MSILVGRKAPDFTASAVLANGEITDKFQLTEVIKDQYCWLFFYPLDFTFVCPSELIALDNRIKEFENRDTLVVGISIDSQFAHDAWRKKPVNQGGIGPVNYPLVADLNHHICQMYGIEHPTAHVALRGSFLIDQNGIVQSQTVNNLPLGRNIDEMLRLIDALQFHEKYGEVCPAGWNKGDIGIKPTEKGIADFLAIRAEGL